MNYKKKYLKYKVKYLNLKKLRGGMDYDVMDPDAMDTDDMDPDMRTNSNGSTSSANTYFSAQGDNSQNLLVMNDENIKRAVSMMYDPDWKKDHPDSKEENYGPIEDWNTSAVTDMSRLFEYNITFNEDIGGWDTSSVTNMSHMFVNAEAFNQYIGKWDTDNVTNMKSMFFGAKAFNNGENTNNESKPLNWNTGNVQTMQGMFAKAVAFNQDISKWKTPNLKNVSMMFYEAEAFKQNIRNWKTPNLKNVSMMFDPARVIREVRENYANNIHENPPWRDTSMWGYKNIEDRTMDRTAELLRLEAD